MFLSNYGKMIKKHYGGFIMAFGLDSSSFSGASGQQLQYVVMQVTLKEKFFGTGKQGLSFAHYYYR